MSARLRQWLREHRGASLCVGLPTLLSAIYFFLIASDLYASEARFVVRSPSRLQVSGIAGLLQSNGITRAQDDVYSVQDFIASRDALATLAAQIDLRAIFGRQGADWLARYPNIWDHDNREDFYRYFQRRVEVIYDTTTGISTLIVKAFRPEDAQAIATRLLDAAESLVNRLNERARVNAVSDAQAQVMLAEEHVAISQQNLLGYRNREVLLDPGKDSSTIVATLTKLQAELAEATTKLSELDQRAPRSPLRSDLHEHIAALQKQIAQQRGHLAGGDGALAPKMSEYEQLALRQEFAGKELASALGSLESARAEARRQVIYLDRVVSASLPDRALFPHRMQSVLIVLVTCFLVYSMAKLVLAGVREHAQQ